MTSSSISHSHPTGAAPHHSTCSKVRAQAMETLPQAPHPPEPPDLLLNPRLYLLQHSCATLLPSPGQGPQWLCQEG